MIYIHLVDGDIYYQTIPPAQGETKERRIIQFEPSIAKRTIATEVLRHTMTKLAPKFQTLELITALLEELVMFCLKYLHSDRYDNYPVNNELLDALTKEEILGWSEEKIIEFIDDSLISIFGPDSRWLHKIVHQIKEDQVEKGDPFDAPFLEQAESLKHLYCLTMYFTGYSREQINNLTISLIKDIVHYSTDATLMYSGNKKGDKSGKVQRTKSPYLKELIDGAHQRKNKNAIPAWVKTRGEEFEKTYAESMKNEDITPIYKESVEDAAQQKAQRAVYKAQQNAKKQEQEES